jgi:hypothetical protein
MNLFQQNHHLIQKLLFIDNYSKEKRKGLINFDQLSYNYLFFRDGLKQIVANVENQLRTSESTTCSRSYQKTSDASQGKR